MAICVAARRTPACCPSIVALMVRAASRAAGPSRFPRYGFLLTTQLPGSLMHTGDDATPILLPILRNDAPCLVMESSARQARPSPPKQQQQGQLREGALSNDGPRGRLHAARLPRHVRLPFPPLRAGRPETAARCKRVRPEVQRQALHAEGRVGPHDQQGACSQERVDLITPTRPSHQGGSSRARRAKQHPTSYALRSGTRQRSHDRSTFGARPARSAVLDRCIHLTGSMCVKHKRPAGEEGGARRSTRPVTACNRV